MTAALYGAGDTAELAAAAAIDAGAAGASIFPGRGFWRDDAGELIAEPSYRIDLVAVSWSPIIAAARAILHAGETAVLLHNLSDGHAGEYRLRDGELIYSELD